MESSSWTDLNGTSGGAFPTGRCNALFAVGDTTLHALIGGNNDVELLAGGMLCTFLCTSVDLFCCIYGAENGLC